MKVLLLAAFPVLLFSCDTAIQSHKNDSVRDTAVRALINSCQYSEDNSAADPENKTGEKLMKTETVGKLHLGLDSKSTQAEMGIPDFKSAVRKWEADGLFHQDWTYDSGIDLNMAGEDSLKMEIFSLRCFTPCSLKTSRNIGIGSSFQEVKDAYRDVLAEKQDEEQALLAGSIYGGIIFSFENGKLSSVFIGAAAE
ncbi:hypothetical protein BH11BAC7_BH11BAC7_10600 [soil metagenome]